MANNHDSFDTFENEEDDSEDEIYSVDEDTSDIQSTLDNAIQADSHQFFADLTLLEVVNEFIHSPRATLRALQETAGASQNRIAIPVRPPKQTRTYISGEIRERMQLGLYFSAYALAFWGCLKLVSAGLRSEQTQLHQGIPLLLAGFFIWLGAEIYGDWERINTWWDARLERIRTRIEAGDIETIEKAPTQGRQSFSEFVNALPQARIYAAFATVFFAIIAYLDNYNNQFRFLGFWSWVASIILVVITFAPSSWTIPNFSDGIKSRIESIGVRANWRVLLILTLIMILAAYFRLYDLKNMPPEMTSDHVEKLLDSQRVRDGARDVFFTNNGGREGFQMYAMAALSYVPGLGINYITLKILAVMESLVTIPVLFWTGKEIAGRDDKKLGTTVGLILAGMVAASYWHVTITRQALRIVLTPLVASLLLIYLSRAMRRNRRGDYIISGLVLGFGLYAYQAVRMLPVVVVVGIGLAYLYHFRDRIMRRNYIINLSALVVVSFVVFVPLFRFSVDYPDLFWMRTAGRLLGDEVIQETNEYGDIVERNATISERLDAFKKNIPALTNNIRNALLMYNWKGDVAWISGQPNHPAMDSFTGGFLIVGLAACGAMIVRRRNDPVYVLIPVMVLIMLLPSALSVAMTIENPSATRTTGSLPPVYLLAALPLGLLVTQIRKIVVGRSGAIIAFGFSSIIILGAFEVNANVYFNKYRETYEISSLPYSEAGRILRGFAISDGNYGNAFMIAYTHWWDHRAVGMEGRINDWINGIVEYRQVPDFLSDGWLCVENTYRLDPEKDLLFFYNRSDEAAGLQLTEWFPTGRSALIDSYQRGDDYMLFRVPALGVEGLRRFLEDNTIDPRCMG